MRSSKSRWLLSPALISFLLLLLLLLLSPLPLMASSFTAKDMLSAPRSGPAIPNPNGTLAVYTQSIYSFDTDSRSGGIHLLPLSTKSSSTITSKVIINDTNAGQPVWLDDSRILYIYTKAGESSLRVYDVDSSTDDEIQKYPGEIGDLKALSIDKETIRIVFSAKVTPHGDIVRANETATPDVLVYDKLWVRHWDTWATPNKQTLLTTTLHLKNEKHTISPDTPVNLLNTTGEIHDLECPIPPFGGAEDFSLSKTHVAFVAKDPHLNPATNTAAHVYVVSFSDADYLEKVNRGPGASSSPVWDPSGEYIAYLEMRVRGYEADRRRVMVFKWYTHEYFALTEEWDRSPSSILWSQDGKSVFLTVEEHGRIKLFELPFRPGKEKTHKPQEIVSEHSLTGVFWSGKQDLLISQSSLTEPSIIQLYDTSKQHLSPLYKPWTHNPLSRKSVSEFWFPGYEAKRVHGFLHLPENFDKKKRYPLAFLIHGGPQGAWEDAWSTRWNPAVFANAGEGWVVAVINPTGSTGYGQAFTDGIQGNWGTRPYFDLESGYEYLLKSYDFIDEERTVALGASYGGYMINWIQGHPLGRKFKALVCHDGIFSTLSAYYATEELYFPEHEVVALVKRCTLTWEFYGPPWEQASVYQDHNPANFIQNWKTPQLVIHGSRDFRLTESEGLSAFTALQKLRFAQKIGYVRGLTRSVPSKLVIFPNENHWVLNPKSSLRWHEEVIGWITKWTSHPHAITEDEDKSDEFVVQT